MNHLLPYPSNTNISAYAGLHGGAFDFAAHPIAPAGTKVVIHDKPAIRASWAQHGTHGYYLGPTHSHYRCYRVWTTSSRSIRISDTLAWFLKGLQLPGPSAHDLFCTAVHDLTNATKSLLTNKTADGVSHPTGQVINTLTDALQQLSAMYPQCTNALIQTTTVDVDPHPEQEKRVIAESTKPPTVSEQRVIVESTNPSTVSEQRVSANSEIQPAIEVTNMQTYETPQASTNTHHDTAPSFNVLLQETVNVPNTLISARNRSRHTVTRPPAITDRVTRLVLTRH